METEQELTPQEYQHLLAQYENSFKNLAGGTDHPGAGSLDHAVRSDRGHRLQVGRHHSALRVHRLLGPGDDQARRPVDVLLERTEDQNGYVVLSKDKAEKMKVWDDVEKAYRSGSTVRGRVIDRIKGGLAVDIGVKAFLPGSLVDVKPVRTSRRCAARTSISRSSRSTRSAATSCSRARPWSKSSRKPARRKPSQLLEEGRVLRGIVKNLTDYGAFVDLGGLDGLLHVTDISWGRVNHPSDLLKVGDEIEVVVLKFDRETERVSLGTKQLTEDPWAHVPEKYPAGSRVTGRVTNVTDYGAFVELEGGVEGLSTSRRCPGPRRSRTPRRSCRPATRSRRSSPTSTPRRGASRCRSRTRCPIRGRASPRSTPSAPRHRQGPQPDRLRRVRRDRRGHRRPRSTCPTCRGRGASSIPRRS